jgi:hypothetical protein
VEEKNRTLIFLSGKTEAAAVLFFNDISANGKTLA